MTVEEEGEDIVVPAEELDRYFLSPSAGSTSSPISKHLETMYKHLDGTFCMDPAASAQLQKSLFRVAKSADSSMALDIKEVG